MPPKATTKKAATTVKKTVSSAAKTTAAHPPFATMISEAITSLKDRSGSSRQAIKKYITENYKVNETLFTKAFNRYLKDGIDSGTFIVCLIACAHRGAQSRSVLIDLATQGPIRRNQAQQGKEGRTGQEAKGQSVLHARLSIIMLTSCVDCGR